MPPRTRVALALTLVALAAGVGLSWWLWSGRDSSRHIPSERAQELYLEGLQLRSRRDIDATDLSIDKFAAALREDPQYAEAWAAYGQGISVAVIRQLQTPAEGIPKARAAAERSIALDPTLADGHAVLGQIYMDHDKNFAAAKREFDRSMELNDQSGLLWHHLAMWHGHLGHLDEAFAEIRRARELEPTRPVFAMNYSLLLYEARRYDEAVAMAKGSSTQIPSSTRRAACWDVHSWQPAISKAPWSRRRQTAISDPTRATSVWCTRNLADAMTRFASSNVWMIAPAAVSAWRTSRRRSTPRWATSTRPVRR